MAHNPWAKPAATLIGIAVLWSGAQIYGFWHASSVVNPAVWHMEDSAGFADISVQMGFAPGQYNLTFLQDKGQIAQFDERHVYLINVKRDAVEAIGQQYWVDSVDPWEPPPT